MSVAEQHQSMVVKEGTRFRCLICANNARDMYNSREHMYTLLDQALIDRMDGFMGRVVIAQGGNQYTCMICRRVLHVQFHALKKHFLHKHFRVAHKYV